jgi:hypothetical protein
MPRFIKLLQPIDPNLVIWAERMSWSVLGSIFASSFFTNDSVQFVGIELLPRILLAMAKNDTIVEVLFL